jgi:hypothetical protein
MKWPYSTAWFLMSAVPPYVAAALGKMSLRGCLQEDAPDFTGNEFQSKTFWQ